MIANINIKKQVNKNTSISKFCLIKIILFFFLILRCGCNVWSSRLPPWSATARLSEPARTFANASEPGRTIPNAQYDRLRDIPVWRFHWQAPEMKKKIDPIRWIYLNFPKNFDSNSREIHTDKFTCINDLL